MISKLRELWNTKPFVPFKIALADGRVLEVPHPEFFRMSPKGGHLQVVDQDDEIYFFNPLVIVSVSKADEPAAH